MQPHLNDGDLALVNKWAYALKKPRIGDVVVFHKDKKLFCKRITGFDADRYYMSGDNPFDSFDSRKFGLVNASQILGKVIGY